MTVTVETSVSPGGPPGALARTSLLDGPLAGAAPYILVAAGYILAYVVLDWAGSALPLSLLGTSPWSPATGLSFALLLLFGLRCVPLLLVALLAASFIVRSDALLQPMVTVSLLLTTAGLSLATAILTRPRVGFQMSLPGLRDLLLLIGVAGAMSAVIALCYTGLVLSVTGTGWFDAVQAALHLWIGDLIGISVVTPLLLVIAAGRRLPKFGGETALQILTIAVTLLVVFGEAHISHFRLFYLLFLPTIWIALRHGLEGAVLSLALTQLGVVVALLLTHEKAGSVTVFQSLMLVLAWTGLAIGAVVSERRRIEQQLRRNREALSRIFLVGSMGQLATAVAHEVSQPLTAISNYTRLIKRHLETESVPKASALEAAEKAVQQIERTAAVIKSLRDLIRLGRSELEPVDVGLIVREALDVVEAERERNAVETDVRIARNLPPVLADRLQIEQALVNLIQNAIEAMSDNAHNARRLRIACQLRSADEVEIAVSDSGPGFPADFDIATLVPLASTKENGLGLGLSLARSIAERHGGRLDVVRSPLGGAAVTLTLRVSQEKNP